MEIEDKAERLRALIEKLQEVSRSQTMVSPRTGQTHTLSDFPLWQSLSEIAKGMTLKDDRDLRDAFVSLCSSVQMDIRSISIRKETVRATWLSRINDISEVFAARNFGTLTREAFAAHFNPANLEALDAISERFHTVGVKESTPKELEEALGAVRDVIETLSTSGELDTRILAVLSHYLQQMELVYSQAVDFGDEIFWRIYKETFATFIQIHPIIVKMEKAEEIKGKMQIVWGKLTSKSIAGVSLGANIATLGTAVYPLLVGA